MASVVPTALAEIRSASGAKIQPLLVAARPRQWSKNLLLFAGIIFAAKLEDGGRWVEATTAFLAYCAASSAAYLVNDVLDAARDREHPLKRFRPVATGDLSSRSALLGAATLGTFALVLAGSLGTSSFGLLLTFLTLQAAYSVRLKHVVLIDIMTIAALFVVRAVAGAVAVRVEISAWLLVCTGLLALFLALGKRRAELALASGDGPSGRPVLSDYSLPFVDQLVSIVAASTVLSYSLYTFTARDSKAMMVTIPFVLFGIFRYLLLIHRRGLGEEPENMLLGDRQIQTGVVLWSITAALILSVGA